MEIIFFNSSSICSEFSFEVLFGDGYLSTSGFHLSVGAAWTTPLADSSILDTDESWSLTGDKDLDLLLAGD